jgi:hypothetical protein
MIAGLKWWQEEQGPRQKKKPKKEGEPESAVVTVDEERDELFVFICTSMYANIAEGLLVPKLRLGTCVDSGASQDYCPDQSFPNISDNSTSVVL